MIQIDESQIEAEVYHKTANGVYLAKVYLPGAGMYINSITVRPSPRYPEKGLWLQMPYAYWGKQPKRHVEFRSNSKLKTLIEDAVWRAVDSFQLEEKIGEGNMEVT
jgi:hypothetical protein